MRFRMETYKKFKKIYFEKMTRHKRAGKNGKILQCPICDNPTRIYHLSWLALNCEGCGKIIPKYEWLIEKSKNKN